MSTDPKIWKSDWTVGLRLWVERAGHAILGKGRLELLEGIDRWHSISGAARQMRMSYRQAWLLVQSMNESAGEPLVAAATGGVHGGGARLTPLGRWAVTVFHDLEQRLQQTAATLLPQLVRGPGTATIHVAAAVSLEEVLGQLLTDYALRQPTVHARAVFAASDELADLVLAGAPADLFLTADAAPLDRLKAAGLLQPDSPVVLAENTLAAIGVADDLVHVRTVRDLARLESGRIALAEPGSPLGRYTRAYLEHLHLADTLLPRVLLVDNSRSVVAAVRAGQAAAGLVYGSDAAHAAGCRILFRVRRLPLPIRYQAAIVRRGSETGPVEALLDFLTSPAAARRFRRCGFLPVSPRPAGGH
jgi:molybdenum ABC transporter molybdate-binding protein